MKITLILLTALLITVFENNTYSDEYAEKLENLLNQYNEIGMFSGYVLLAKDGSVVYEKQFGFADWENKTPVTQEIMFRIGSLNKMFTHAMIKQLEKDGKLSLDDKLNKYLDIYTEETGGKITIQMLIEMKAGLGDYLNNPEFRQNPGRFRTVDDFLEMIKNEQLLFEPGTSSEYSNSGYVVLGGIIEKITGKSYIENLNERFINPLGLLNTHYLLIGETLPNTAKGTRILFSGEKVNSHFEEQPSPAGGMYSTAHDLLKFDTYLKETGLLPAGIRAGGNQVWNSVLAQLKDGYTLIITSNFGQAADEIITRYVKILEGKEYPKPDVTLQMKMYEILKKEGTAGLENKLKELLQANDMMYNDMHLNFFGYELMQSGLLNEAIEVFELNVKLFPEIANVYDSLGEAYMNAGDEEKAVKNYRKVLELEPGNMNAKKMLEKING